MGGDDERVGLGSVPERWRSGGEVVSAIVDVVPIQPVIRLATIRASSGGGQTLGR